MSELPKLGQMFLDKETGITWTLEDFTKGMNIAVISSEEKVKITWTYLQDLFDSALYERIHFWKNLEKIAGDNEEGEQELPKLAVSKMEITSPKVGEVWKNSDGKEICVIGANRLITITNYRFEEEEEVWSLSDFLNEFEKIADSDLDRLDYLERRFQLSKEKPVPVQYATKEDLNAVWNALIDHRNIIAKLEYEIDAIKHG